MMRHGTDGQDKSTVAGAPVLAVGVLLLAVHGVVFPPFPPFPQGESWYFAEAGFYVEGPLLDFYRARGGREIFGYPLTRRFFDSELKLWVQYFDNARMEWHPQNPSPYQVQLGLLAQELGFGGPPIPAEKAPTNNPLRRYFPETGHVVSYAFLRFYDRKGGLDIFGYPISEPMVENGRIVQYFQRARMEWYPERPVGSQVILSRLGVAYVQRFSVPEAAQAREPGSGTARVATLAGEEQFDVSTFVRNAITGRTGEQTVYLYVTREGGQPLAGAVAAVTVSYSSRQEVYTVGPTDGRGLASVTFPIEGVSCGQKVLIEAMVEIEGQRQTASTFFVPWY